MPVKRSRVPVVFTPGPCHAYLALLRASKPAEQRRMALALYDPQLAALPERIKEARFQRTMARFQAIRTLSNNPVQAREASSGTAGSEAAKHGTSDNFA